MNGSFITGFPRSRTCWLSELLTCSGHSYAFHEAGLRFKGLSAWREAVEARPEPNVIDCNSGVLFLSDTPQFSEAFHEFKFVVIVRDEKEACRSYQNFLMQAGLYDRDQFVKTWDRLCENMGQMLADSSIPNFDYRSLDDEYTCSTIANIVAPGFPWDSERFEALKLKKIVQHPSAAALI